MYKITIKWGTDGEVTKTYSFDDMQQYQWFMKGVDEAEGWLKYEIVLLLLLSHKYLIFMG